uniref:Putative secreted peptide n=1 Tax=Anopheles braziliensis TaxID=58242 RepID=A0A2M3ZR77_9DIPT
MVYHSLLSLSLSLCMVLCHPLTITATDCTSVGRCLVVLLATVYRMDKAPRKVNPFEHTAHSPDIRWCATISPTGPKHTITRLRTSGFREPGLMSVSVYRAVSDLAD